MYVPDSQLVQDEDDLESSRAGMMEENSRGDAITSPHVSISTTKVNFFLIGLWCRFKIDCPQNQLLYLISVNFIFIK